ADIWPTAVVRQNEMSLVFSDQLVATGPLTLTSEVLDWVESRMACVGWMFSCRRERELATRARPA
ncbi:MAG TPA: hypothetical protein VKT80_07035, partial [Chloroflexota bacterium]|nr:hypothetical protein [Chloroflexota bacterium]